MTAFVAVESRVSEPMLPLGLFRRPAFTGVQLAAFAISAAAFALFLYIGLYLQNYLGYTPLQAGLRYLPITLAAFLVARCGGPAHPGPRPGPAERRPGAVGPGLLLMSGISAGSEWTTLLGGFLVLGAGVGLLNPVIGDVALSVVPKERSGMAAGINDTFRQVGVAVGVAVWGAIFVGQGAAKVSELTAGTATASGDHPRQLVEAASSGSLNQALAAVPAARSAGDRARRPRGFPRRHERGAHAGKPGLLRRRRPGSLAGSRARHRARTPGATGLGGDSPGRGGLVIRRKGRGPLAGASSRAA